MAAAEIMANEWEHFQSLSEKEKEIWRVTHKQQLEEQEKAEEEEAELKDNLPKNLETVKIIARMWEHFQSLSEKEKEIWRAHHKQQMEEQEKEEEEEAKLKDNLPKDNE